MIHNTHHLTITCTSITAVLKTICDKKTQFDCGGGMCIPLSKVCDKHPDCPNFEDEPRDRCGENECAKNNGGCTQKCVDTPVGYYCDCDKGYKLVDNRTCEGKIKITHPFICLRYGNTKIQ